MTAVAPVALLASAGVAALAAAPAGRPAANRKPQKKTVKVYDNYYGPTKLTVNAGSTSTWKWTERGRRRARRQARRRRPKGAKKFQSDPLVGRLRRTGSG